MGTCVVVPRPALRRTAGPPAYLDLHGQPARSAAPQPLGERCSGLVAGCRRVPFVSSD